MRRVLLLGAAALFAALPLTAQRRRAVGPVIYTGHVDVAVAYVLSDTTLAEVQLHLDDLSQAGLHLVGNRLMAGTVPAAGFRVVIGDQDVMVHTDGSFFIDGPPSGSTLQVIGKGIVLGTFPVATHVVRAGETPAPVVVNLELSDRADMMNDWDQAVTPPPVQSDAVAPEGLCPTPGPDCKVDNTCAANPTTCCRDYNGLCADGKRYQGDGCTLRFLQFTGST